MALTNPYKIDNDLGIILNGLIYIDSGSQKTGIGIASPREILDINGAIIVSASSAGSPITGTIEWNSGLGHFRGRNASGCVNLDAPGLLSAYTIISDGIVSATAVSSDTITFKSIDDTLSIEVTEAHPTYGNFVNLEVNISNIASQINLSDLGDVNIDTSVNDGDSLIYDSTSGTWINGNASNVGIRYNILTDVTVYIPANIEYLVYGDLTLDGTLINDGKIVIINGGFINNSGNFVNNGTIEIVNLQTANSISSYTISFSAVANTPFTITHNLGTSNIIWSIFEGDQSIEADFEIIDSNTVEVTSNTNASIKLNIVGF